MDVSSFSLLFAMLAVIANLSLLGLLIVAVLIRTGRSPRLTRSVTSFLADNGLLIAWTVALVSTAGSLYYSEVAGFTPCELCWYQRIAMYPLSMTLGIAYFRRDVHVRRYVLPVAAVGASISVFHYLLQRFPTLSSGSCDVTAPCTVTWVWQFHYISIPFMALSGFGLIIGLLAVTKAHPEGADDDDLFATQEEESPVAEDEARAFASTSAP